jgi:hypothetical protein
MSLSRDEIFKIIEDAEDEYWHDPDMNNEHKNWIMSGMIEEKLNAPGNAQQQVQPDSALLNYAIEATRK